MQRWKTGALGLALPVLGACQVSAHTGQAAGFALADGLLHPLLGADHVAAALAVGLWAALAGGRARLAWPVAFLALMLAGNVAGNAGVGLPARELLIAASVIGLGAVVALDLRPPLVVGMALCGAFALAHGFAHGAEIPSGAAPGLYGAGLLAATALLHGAGLALGLAVTRRPVLRLAGVAIAATGIVLAAT